MADLMISDLPIQAREDVSGTDPLAVADMSASETKQLKVVDLFVQALSSPVTPENYIAGGKLLDASVVGDKLIDDSVEARKLDPATIPASGGLNVNGELLQLTPPTAPLTINANTGSLGHGTSGVIAGRHIASTVDAMGHVTEGGPLLSADMPAATTTERGAVRPGSGLVLNGDALDHSNNAIEQTISGLAIDNHGHIKTAVPLAGTDLPTATRTSKGAVMPGTGLDMASEVLNLQPATGASLGGVVVGPALQIDGIGVINLALAGAAGTWAKVGVDTYGRVVQGLTLEPADLPGIDASKITSGTFPSERLATNSVTAKQLADYGIAQVSQTRPKPEFAGQWWINPIDRSAYVWIGTVDGPGTVENGYWMNLGYGTAVEQNARFGGTYDASTNLVESISTYGNLAGVVAGNALPPPTQTNAGLYLIVTVSGVGVTPAPEESLAVGDWVFSLGTGTNWVKIAVISGAGGGVSDEDVLVTGAGFSVPMPNVANQEEANELMWSYCQPASGVLRGTVMPSNSVVVDAAGVMEVNIVDEGNF